MKGERVSRICLALLAVLGVINYGAIALGQERKSFFSLNPTEIEEYRNVVRALRALPVSDPRSWLYLSGMHQHIEPNELTLIFPTSPTNQNEAKPFALVRPQHATDNKTWDQCHLSDPDPVFLLWHRVYLYYFEKIAQKVSQQPDFRVPYWDYSNSAVDAERTRIPEAFRSEVYTPPGGGQQQPNPLYAVRRESVNRGGSLDLSIIRVDTAMALKDFPAFQDSLEGLPHNQVHSAIGKENTLLMGHTIWAAQDPIFMLHHSNIDRIWQCWENQAHKSPLPQLQHTFMFIDENGKVVKHTIKEMYQLASTINAKYESQPDCGARRIAEAPVKPKKGKRITAFSAPAGILLGPEQTIVPLSLTQDGRRTFSAGPKTAINEPRAILKLEDIKSKQVLGALYKIKIRQKGDNTEGLTVGSLSLFGLGEKGRKHKTKKIEIDVTESVTKNGEKLGTEDWEIIFVPSTGIVGDVKPSAQAIEAAQPRVGKMKIEIVP